MFSRMDTAPHGVEPQRRWSVADWLGLVRRASASRGGSGPIAGLDIPPCICNSGNGGAKTEASLVDAAPHGLETPTQPPKVEKQYKMDSKLESESKKSQNRWESRPNKYSGVYSLCSCTIQHTGITNVVLRSG